MTLMRQVDDVRRLALLGGLLGLGVGLILWAWSATQPSPTTTNGTGAVGGPSTPVPSATARPSTGVLGEDTGPATAARPPGPAQTRARGRRASGSLGGPGPWRMTSKAPSQRSRGRS